MCDYQPPGKDRDAGSVENMGANTTRIGHLGIFGMNKHQHGRNASSCYVRYASTLAQHR